MKKEELFDKLRRNTREHFDMPDLTVNAIKYPDTLKQFIEMSQTVGGKVKCIKKVNRILYFLIFKILLRHIYKHKSDI